MDVTWIGSLWRTQSLGVNSLLNKKSPFLGDLLGVYSNVFSIFFCEVSSKLFQGTLANFLF